MKRNFTLVELLVVIGVIAILTALLLPALSSSRSKARRIQDLSNMKQIGTGLHAYSDASKGYMPCCGIFLIDGFTAYFTGGNMAWSPATGGMGLGSLFAGGYITNPRIFFCTEPYFNGSSYFTYDNPDSGWANWNQSGKIVYLSSFLPNHFFSKGDLTAVKASYAVPPVLSGFPMSNMLSDNTKKVVLSCYGYSYKYHSIDKPPHDGDGVNIIFGDNSGRWQKIDETALAAEGGYGAARVFAWLNANANR